MPNSLLTAEQEMVGRLLDNLPSGFTADAVKLPNLEFTTPNNSPWLRATMVPLSTASTVATGKCERTTGLFVVDVFYPKLSGTHAALATAEAIKLDFVNQGTDNVSFFDAQIVNLDDPDWYGLQVNIEYTHEGLTYAD